MLVADAAGNSLLRVDDDEISTEAVFPQHEVVVSPTLTIFPDSVPTSIVVIDEEEYYVAEFAHRE